LLALTGGGGVAQSTFSMSIMSFREALPRDVREDQYFYS
jgi:hypothetical protein